jgi:hypothetical protein
MANTPNINSPTENVLNTVKSIICAQIKLPFLKAKIP